MSTLLGICAVVCTLSFVMITFAILRAVRKFEDVSNEVSKTAESARLSLVEIRAISKQVEQLTSAVELPLQRAASEVGDVGHRAAQLSHAMLNEVEGPIRTTVAMLVGLRTGTRSLVNLLSRRAGRTQSNGGYSHE
jgi:hypothetical protein